MSVYEQTGCAWDEEVDDGEAFQTECPDCGGDNLASVEEGDDWYCLKPDGRPLLYCFDCDGYVSETVDA